MLAARRPLLAGQPPAPHKGGPGRVGDIQDGQDVGPETLPLRGDEREGPLQVEAMHTPAGRGKEPHLPGTAGVGDVEDAEPHDRRPTGVPRRKALVVDQHEPVGHSDLVGMNLVRDIDLGD